MLENMTHAEEIFRAAVIISYRNNGIFTRKEVRDKLGLSHQEWMSGYTAIFQGMRDDHPGGAPNPGSRFKNVFHKVAHGKYQLTKIGSRLAKELNLLAIY